MRTIIPLLALAAALSGPLAAHAAEKNLHCSLTFSTKEWSALYASASGEGTVSCEDGSSMPVVISAKGAGLTAGKWQITDGKGAITRVEKIDDVLGSYLAVSGDIGVVKAGTAKVLTKGKVSLALAGKGEGFDIGIAITQFKISKAPAK